MIFRFSDYKGGHLFCSIAKDLPCFQKLLEHSVSSPILMIGKGKMKLYPSDVELNCSKDHFTHLNKLNNLDILEIQEDGRAQVVYSNCSEDNLLFVTSRCNSNCIMCPSPEYSRRNGNSPDCKSLIQLAQMIPDDTPHLTITGGEPFLAGRQIFELFQILKDRFTGTEFLVLTNGRIFCLDTYVNKLKRTAPSNILLGIPIHGSNEEIHDLITQAPGSFTQTCKGISNLLEEHFDIEFRVVVNRMNYQNLEDLAHLIVSDFSAVRRVSIMAMEMTGSARDNREKVWISYREAGHSVQKMAVYLMKNGIDVMLFNFPHCALPSGCWFLCRKSISDYKVRFAPQCEKCLMKNDCGGVFGGTFQMVEKELVPVHEIELF